MNCYCAIPSGIAKLLMRCKTGLYYLLLLIIIMFKINVIIHSMSAETVIRYILNW